MHWRYRLRKQQLLDECEVPPEVFRGGLERLAAFARPFADGPVRQEPRDRARTSLAGSVSDGFDAKPSSLRQFMGVCVIKVE